MIRILVPSHSILLLFLLYAFFETLFLVLLKLPAPKAKSL